MAHIRNGKIAADREDRLEAHRCYRAAMKLKDEMTRWELFELAEAMIQFAVADVGVE